MSGSCRTCRALLGGTEAFPWRSKCGIRYQNVPDGSIPRRIWPTDSKCAAGADRTDRAFAAFLEHTDAAWRYDGPLSDDVVAALSPPPYWADKRDRRITIGSYPGWSTAQARTQAAALRRRIDLGEDPMAERHEQRAAATVNDLADRFEVEHLPRKRESTQYDYRRVINRHIRPTLGKIFVSKLRHTDVEALHRKVAEHSTYVANRCVAVLSKMLSLSIRWDMRADNPARGIERAPEEKRERFLTPAEIARLADALAKEPQRAAANAIRLLLLTGAGRGEVLKATWDQFDLVAGVWSKPAATTKQAKTHRVPLSAPALALLTEMRRDAAPDQPFLFPGLPGRPLTGVKRFWASVCREARITDTRVHDLRHSYASILASRGLSLPIIGALLGHTQSQATQRYAHLLDDPLRAATEAAGAFITSVSDKPAEVIPHPAARRR